MAAQVYLQTPFNSAGQPPEPRMEIIMADTRRCVFPEPVIMPAHFIRAQEAPAIRPAQVMSYANEAHFGESPGKRPQQPPRVIHSNPNVDPLIAAICNHVRSVDPQATMQGVLQGSSVKLQDVILVDNNCVDFHSFGVCKRGDCKFHHDPTARPDQERIARFLKLATPLAVAFASRCPTRRRKT